MKAQLKEYSIEITIGHSETMGAQKTDVIRVSDAIEVFKDLLPTDEEIEDLVDFHRQEMERKLPSDEENSEETIKPNKG